VKLTSKKAKSVKVTGKKAGKAVVTAKVGKQTKKVTITVKKAAVKKTAVTAVALSADNAKDPAKEVLVGTKLRAAVTPENATVTYQWKADGTAIAGATGSAFTVTTAEIGKAITVEATGTGNFEKTAVSAATAKVAAVSVTGIKAQIQQKNPTTNKDEFVDYGNQSITVGSVLKAETVFADNTSTNGEVFDYQWYRVGKAANDNATETAIAGATSQTYTVTKADMYSELKVVATPKTNVTATGKVKGVYTATFGKVSADITVEIQANGKKADGVVANTALTAVVTPSDAAVTYQWYKGGARIQDATAATYTPTTDGDYSVRVSIASSETTYKNPAAGYAEAKVKVGSKSFSNVTLTDKTNADSKETPKKSSVLPTDAFEVTVPFMGGTVAATNYDVEYTLDGQKVTLSSDNKLSATDQAKVKVGSTLAVTVTGKGDYAGSTATASITFTSLGEAKDLAAFKNVAFTVDSAKKEASITGLPTKDYTLGKDYTLTLQGLVTATDGTSSWKTLGTAVENKTNTAAASVDFNIAGLDTTGVTQYRLVLSIPNSGYVDSNIAVTKTTDKSDSELENGDTTK